MGTCYVWHEMTAGRGPNDIASCVFQFIQTSAKEGMTDLRIVSDSCSCQNRNRFMFAMMLLGAVRFKIKITHLFMEPGHTQNENDSIYARIELSAKGKDLFDFDEVVELIKTAKVEKPPYEVVLVKQDQVYDFKALVALQNWMSAESGEKVKWSKVRTLEFNPNDPGDVKFKYEYDGDFLTLKVNARRGRPVNLVTYPLLRAYNGLLPLAANKVKDLKKLCKARDILTEYHGFWKQILLTSQELQPAEANNINIGDEDDVEWAEVEETEVNEAEPAGEDGGEAAVETESEGETDHSGNELSEDETESDEDSN